jgi:hypothetical protein
VLQGTACPQSICLMSDTQATFRSQTNEIHVRTKEMSLDDTSFINNMEDIKGVVLCIVIVCFTQWPYAGAHIAHTMSHAAHIVIVTLEGCMVFC